MRLARLRVNIKFSTLSDLARKGTRSIKTSVCRWLKHEMSIWIRDEEFKENK